MADNDPYMGPTEQPETSSGAQSSKHGALVGAIAIALTFVAGNLLTRPIQSNSAVPLAAFCIVYVLAVFTVYLALKVGGAAAYISAFVAGLFQVFIALELIAWFGI